MPFISTFVYAEEAQVLGEGKKMNLTNPRVVFKIKYIPGQFSFVVLWGIMDVNLEEPIEIRYIFMDPDGEVIIETNDIKIEKPQNILDWDNSIMINLELRNVDIPNEGMYKSEVFINNVSLGVFPIIFKGMKPTNER